MTPYRRGPSLIIGAITVLEIGQLPPPIAGPSAEGPPAVLGTFSVRPTAPVPDIRIIESSSGYSLRSLIGFRRDTRQDDQ